MPGKSSSDRLAPEMAAHKLFAPPPCPGAIVREGLLERIFGAESARVVLLQGPAGHGKSTLLQQLKSIFDERGHLSAWLTLDEADNDARRFYLHAQAMVSSLGAAGTEPEGGRRSTDWLLGRLGQTDMPVTLFIDDFQVLTNKTLLNFFREVFERLPEHVRLFVGTRSTPEIGLSRLIVNQRALLLQADHLRFSPTEVERFFAGDLSGISAGEIAEIYRRTEGWPAALQLFRLSLGSAHVRESLSGLADFRPRELAEYLADHVLALQPPEVQDFLLRTALLGRLCAPLCEAVTGRADAQEMLLRLERGGLFVRSLDSDMRWFKYHALFSSFLADQLQAQSPETMRAVHAAAAQWHLDQGYDEETVRHAIACGDFALAADTLEHWAARLICDAQLVTLERWIEQLPFEEVARRPGLLIKAAWMLVFLHRRAKLQPLIELLEARAAAGATDGHIVLSMAAISADEAAGSQRWVRQVPLREERHECFAAFELGAAANLSAYHTLAANDFETTRALLALARAHNERGGAIFSTGYTMGLQGMNLIAQGQLREALDGFRAGMAESRMHVDKSVASAVLVASYIWGLYEANQLDQAEALFGRHHDIISESALLDWVAVAYLAVVRIHDARGRTGRALEVLDEAEAIGHHHGWERLIATVNWERARRALLGGSLDRAVAIAALVPALPALPTIQFSDDAEGAALGSIRLAVHRLDFATAADALATEFQRARGRSYRLIKLYLLEAQLHQLRGEPNGAHRCLRKALQLAGAGGFVRCFLDEGEVVLQLLREDYQRLLESEDDEAAPGVSRGFVEQLLQASGTDLSRSAETRCARPVEALTDREKEILVFLANGVSNKEMARRLFVSENTIKFHLKNIYAKLAVTSRLQAITAGRKLGLVR